MWSVPDAFALSQSWRVCTLAHILKSTLYGDFIVNRLEHYFESLARALSLSLSLSLLGGAMVWTAGCEKAGCPCMDEAGKGL